jgi:hypothetical protein
MGQMSAEPPLQKEPGGAAHGMGEGDSVWPEQSASSARSLQ